MVIVEHAHTTQLHFLAAHPVQAAQVAAELVAHDGRLVRHVAVPRSPFEEPVERRCSHAASTSHR